MPFDLTISTAHSGEFNWFDLPESNRPDLETARDKFNLIQYQPGERLRVEGPSTAFDEAYADITGIRIDG